MITNHPFLKTTVLHHNHAKTRKHDFAGSSFAASDIPHLFIHLQEEEKDIIEQGDLLSLSLSLANRVQNFKF
jgi:hypothetical protein